MGDYIKDAYKKIYRHPKWAEEARAYENNLAVALYKNPYVQQASQDALRRVSEVLTAFFRAGADMVITYHALDYALRFCGKA